MDEWMQSWKGGKRILTVTNIWLKDKHLSQKFRYIQIYTFLHKYRQIIFVRPKSHCDWLASNNFSLCHSEIICDFENFS